MTEAEELAAIKDELAHIKHVLGDIILPLLTYVLEIKIEMKPNQKQAINDLISRISKQ